MDILFTKELIKCTTGLDIHVIKNEPKELLPLLGEAVRGIILVSEAENMIRHLFSSIRPGTIYEVNAVLGVCYTVFSDNKDNFILIGPCVESGFSAKEAQQLLQNKQYPSWALQTFIEYCRYLPIVSHQKRHQIANLLARSMLESDVPLPYQRLNFNLTQDERNRLLLADRYEEISRIRLIEKRQQELLSLTEAVTQGNLSLAYSFLNFVSEAIDEEGFGDDALRTAQNNCIILNTRLHKAMEDCGIHPYSLGKVSAEISEQIEKLRNVKEAKKYLAEIVRIYCKISRENKYPSLAPFSNQVVTYIKNHLSDNISVKSTAAALVMNPDYLSNRFHRETGETFISFLNRERVEQAAVLLKGTNMLIKDVAASVGFNNTSYFAKQFLLYKGLSPSAYRSDAKL